MKENYVIWLETGTTSIAKCCEISSDGKMTVTMPMCLMNIPSATDKDGNVVQYNSPAAKTLHYHTDMIPYIFPEMTGEGLPTFHLNRNNLNYMMIDSDATLAKQYEIIVANLHPTKA